MSEEEQEVEEISLTESDMAVIEELNEERSGEEVSVDDDISVEETEETSQDIDTGTARIDGKFLRYDASQSKWVGDDAATNGKAIAMAIVFG